MGSIGSIQKAAKAGDLFMVQRLLGEGVDVNDAAEDSATPLHWAVAWGRDAVVDFLLDRGADVNAKDDEGNTPLHLATRKGYTTIHVVERLLTAENIEINARTIHGMTPLHGASARGRKDIVEVLLARGADAAPRNKDGRTPLALAEACVPSSNLGHLGVLGSGLD